MESYSQKELKNPKTIARLHEAMSYLASVCDGAFEKDGQGFSKPDSYNGKYLAGKAEWTEDETWVAAKYAQKYIKQIKHIFDEKSFEGINDILYSDTNGVLAKERVTENRRKAYNKPVEQPNVATLEGDIITTDTGYNAEFVTDSKKIPSRRWKGGRINTFHIRDLKAVLDLCDKYEVEVQFDIPAAQVQVTTVAPAPVKAKTAKIVGNVIEIEFPFDAAIVVAIKQPGVAKWDKDKKIWTVDLIHAGRFAEILAPFGFKVDPAMKSAALQSVQNKTDYKADSTSFRAEIPQLRPEFHVLPHQWVPIEWALKNGHVLNADSQGLGKTFVSLVTLILKKTTRAVVIAPASLTENWAKESQMFFHDGTFTVFKAEGRTPSEIPADANLVILSWDVFTNWQETLTKWNPEAIIVDEAHYGKSGKKSKRGEAFIKFGKENKKALKIALTGTPILNRPLELLAVLLFFGIEKMFGGVVKFKNRYCDPRLVPNAYSEYPVYTYNGATNIPELHDILTSSGVYLRRTKKILIDQGLLKNKYVNGVEFFDYNTPRTPTYIKLTPDEIAEYQKVQKDFKDSITLKRYELAKEMGLHPNHPLVVNAITSNKGGEALVLLNEFRKRVGFLKMRGVIEYVKELVAKGERVVLFAHHRDIVDAYAAEFSGIKIQGGMGVKKIEEAKQKFNGTPFNENPVLVVSIEAGKTGHTLCLQRKNGVGQECAHAIFAEEPYVYGDSEQAEDRIYRIGQSRDVFITNLMVKDTVDERIYNIRESKRKVFNALVDGVVYEEEDEDSVAQQILKEYI